MFLSFITLKSNFFSGHFYSRRTFEAVEIHWRISDCKFNSVIAFYLFNFIFHCAAHIAARLGTCGKHFIKALICIYCCSGSPRRTSAPQYKKLKMQKY